MMPESRVRPILLLLSGNFLGAAVGGAFFVLASRRLTLDEMGRYAVAISVQWVAFGLIGTGLAIATLRLVRARLSQGDRKEAAGVVLSAILLAGGGAVVLATVTLLLLRIIGPGLSIAPAIAALAILWAGSRAILDSLRSGLLAQQDFLKTALLTSISALTGLTALGVTLWTGEISVARLLPAHVAGLFFGALASTPLLRSLARDGIRPNGTRALLTYARWPALSEGVRLLNANLGAPLLVALAGPAQAGLFGLGRYPAFVFDVVAVSLYQYWLSKAVHVSAGATMRAYLGRQLRLAGAIGLVMIAGALLVQPLLPLLGENFAGAGKLFVLGAVDFAIVLLIRPIESVFHGLGRPRLELAQRCVTFPILLAVALLFVSRWGAMGMAAAHIVTSMASLAVGLMLALRALGADSMRPRGEADAEGAALSPVGDTS